MFDDVPTPSDRRGFLTRTVGSAAIAALGALPPRAAAEPPALATDVDARKGWLDGVTTECRQFFETAKMDDAVPLLHVVNYFEAWRATPGIAATDVTAVVGVSGMAVPALFGDALWQKYALGKAMKLGARIILCNNALGAWVGRTPAATGQPMPAVRAEWLAALAPGVMLVPSLVQAVAQAQRAGLTYIKNS